MISKLVTWGETRKEAQALLLKAMDEYVIKGVTHNIGFGRSILNNEGYSTGNYSTSFIPLYYPTGFRGELLTDLDFNLLALTAFQLKKRVIGHSHLETV
jgi:propionyl-CoA carboxylase alpha chain